MNSTVQGCYCSLDATERKKSVTERKEGWKTERKDEKTRDRDRKALSINSEQIGAP